MTTRTALIAQKPAIVTDFSLCGCAICRAASDAHAHGKTLPDVAFIPADLNADAGNFIDGGTFAAFDGSPVQDPVALAIPGTSAFPGQQTNFGFTLVAGQTYIFSLRGTGATPLNDPLLGVFAQLDADPPLELARIDDDGGDRFNSLITYTATYTGLHVIAATGQPFPGNTGTWTLDVVVRNATDESDSFASATPLTVGGIYYGFIDFVPPPAARPYGPAFGEVDTFQITLEAGKAYVIEASGGTDYLSSFSALPPGEVDTVMVIYNSALEVVASNDDASFANGDIGSGIAFVAEETGTYFIDVFSYVPWTGGYSITAKEVDLSVLDPLDSLNWVSADNIEAGDDGVVKVYFSVEDESFGELADNGVDPLPSFGWNAFEKQQVFDALLEFSKILGLTYVETTNSAEADFRLITTTSEQYGAYFYPQDPAFGTQQGIGAFNVDSGGWLFDQQQSLVQGGFAFAVILHEFGHAHGLAHPHDNGGGSDIMAGVFGPFDSYGFYDLNQGVYTVMSYNDAWPLHPDGPSPFTAAGVDNGWSGTLSAFDIAILQQRYGVSPAYATGNDVYMLKDVAAQGTYYETIYDTGGTDEIRYVGARDAQIDLTAATLDYSATGGGVVSFVREIKGGFTIAGGILIENATSGDGDDVLIGNGAANVLTANGGDDFLIGGLGGDTLNGGSGFDIASYREAASGVSASLTSGGGSGSGSGGEAAGDSFTGIEELEGSAFNDTLTSGNGNHTLSGLAGNDALSGGNGNDTLNGGDGNDNATGDNGDDVLDGGAGTDTLSGGKGDDRLNGGAGNDTMTGGNGDDVFAFTEIGGADRVTDLKRGDDEIDLSGIDAVTGGGDDAFTFIGSGAFTGVAGQLRAYTTGSDKFLAGDVDGDAVADFTIQTNILIVPSDLVL